MLIVEIIIGLLIVGGGLIWFYRIRSKLTRKIAEFEAKQNQWNAKEQERKDLEHIVDITQMSLHNLRHEIAQYQNTQYKLEQIQREKLQESFNDLNVSIAEKRSEEQQIRDKVINSQQMLEQLNASYKQVNEQFAATTKEINNTIERLNSLKQQHKAATIRLEQIDSGRTMVYSTDDMELTKTLEHLKYQYPQLSGAFSTIEWTNIWQTKFQSMTTDLLKADKCGIYRIFTVNGDEVRSYIGQAKKIRDRWSQHIKKMLGVEKSDNSKLYNAVKPWDAHFEIVEECSEQELNDKEHYWIDYYNCVEQGYNIKN